MPLTELILGGARSGKSRYAEQRAQESNRPVVYIATAQALDPEMDQRIVHHRAQRPAEWPTVEEPLALAAAIERIGATQPDATILVDCLTLWLTNCLLSDDGDCFAREKAALLQTLSQCSNPVLMVSNEVGYGIVPMGELSRRFVDETGRLHQDIAAIVASVTLVVAGIPMAVKRPPTHC
ncbi:bifunctional adenosylcobinamide kinase/adenosylcobinamide-phosphate guanylyltransferase [Thalassolituus sp. LLYu03]|uniref:bifunctional adenosylcobinamide kinase/adenosylcobinamide-phosphate guanylyltransferase n=1 Tax=Thalassolituus sp. LLYu03 TaxID=3421656 RepID=UPI003D2870C6